MKKALNNLTNQVFGWLGLKLTSVQQRRILDEDVFAVSLQTMLLAMENLKIVQVGANDGKWGDPLWNVIARNSNRTRLLLIEPQPEVAEILSKNYENHPDHRIFVGALGPPGSKLALHRVRPEFWERLQAPYLRDAPAHRAPSGIASLDRRQVEKNLRALSKKRVGRNFSFDEVIEELTVPVMTMQTLLEKYPEMCPVDVLVIDVEGLDDEILYGSLTPGFLPQLLYFEYLHLDLNRKQELLQFLDGLGYVTHELIGNVLAVRSQ